MRRHTIPLLTIAIAYSGWLGAACSSTSESQGCKTDTDCKGDRVCSAGECISSSSSSSTGGGDGSGGGAGDSSGGGSGDTSGSGGAGATKPSGSGGLGGALPTPTGGGGGSLGGAGGAVPVGGAGGGEGLITLCEDTCIWANDGVCDDGGDGGDIYCLYGADCSDCGPRNDAICLEECWAVSCYTEAEACALSDDCTDLNACVRACSTEQCVTDCTLASTIDAADILLDLLGCEDALCSCPAQALAPTP